MSWRLTSLGTEAIRNLASSRVRTVAMVGLAAILSGGLAAVEYSTTDSLLSFQRLYTVRGGYLAVVSDKLGVPAERCTSLKQRSDVLAVGGFQPGIAQEVNLAPGTLFQVATVTNGLPSLWAPTSFPAQLDMAGTLIVGGSAAKELGIGPGRWLKVGETTRLVGAVLDTEDRSPEVGRWILAIQAPVGVVKECWVEFTPTGYEAGLGVLSAIFSDGGPGVSVNRYRRLDEFSLNPPQALRDRPQANAWLVLGSALGAIGWLGFWFRRSEFGLYRAIGTSTMDLVTIMWFETALTFGTGLAFGSLWATTIHDATERVGLNVNQISIALRNISSTIAVAMVLAPLASIALGRSEIANQLKDR